MKKNDNFDFIKNKFEQEGVKAPVELDESNIDRMLFSGNSRVVKLRSNKIKWRAAVAAVACLAVVVVGTFSAVTTQNKQPEAVVSGDFGENITCFDNYSQIKSYIKKSMDKFSIYGFANEDIFFSKNEAMAVADDSSKNPDSTGSSSFSQTYKQYDDVDEADLVKTDGKYIYYLNDLGDKITIASAENGKTKRVSKITIDDYYFNAREFYLRDNKVILLGWKYEDNSTFVTTYDVSDIENPKQISKYCQSGYIISSRMIGDYLYVISNYDIYRNNVNIKFPYVVCEDGEKDRITPEDIYAIKDSKEPNYLVVGAIDTSSEKNNTETKAILGTSGNVYCNEKNLYIINEIYNYNDAKKAQISFAESINTQIVKLELDKTSFNFKAFAKVNGAVNDNFSLDEKDGYLRIATTSTKNSHEVNNLFVLDESLDVVGSVTGFAKNEQVKSARFVGDTAYIVTYERTDPLFVIDVSDPKNPQMKGNVKITGFSTLLLPLDNNRLLGIGYTTNDDDIDEIGMEATDGIKISLFDVSNPNEPKVLDSEELRGYESNVQRVYKALVVNKKKGYFAMDFCRYKDARGGAITFECNNDEIEITNKFNVPKNAYISRCAYIDDYLYLIDYSDCQIYSFEV